MSHVTVTKLKIEGLNREILKKALEKVAEKHGAKLVDASTIKDYYGRDVLGNVPDGKIVYGIKGGALKYGAVISADEKTGEIEVSGDFWASGLNVNQLTGEVNTEYVKEGVTEALEDIGLGVSNVVDERDAIVIEAEEVF